MKDEKSYTRLEDYLDTQPDIVEFSGYLFDWHPFEYQEKPLRDESKRLLMNFGRQCLAADEYIYTPHGIKRVEDVRNGDDIIGGRVSNRHDFLDDIYEITFSTGVKIRCNREHPFFTKGLKARNEWRKLDEIKKLKRPRVQFIDSKIGGLNLGEEYFRFFGYMLSDGYWGKKQSPKFTNVNTEFIEEMKGFSRELYGIEPKIRSKGNGYDLHFTQSHGTSTKNPIIEDIETLGVFDKNTFGNIQASTNECLKQFIGGFFNGDGYLSLRYTKDRNPKIELGFAVGTCKRKAVEFQFMLWKLGIFSYVKEEMNNNKFYRVMVNGNQDNLTRALDILPTNKYPKKFKTARKILSRPIQRTYINYGWIAIKKIKHIGKGKVVGWTTEGTHEIISYCGMRTHNSGKSDICSIKGLYKAMTEEATTVLIVSPTQRQSSLLFRKIKYKLNKMAQRHPEFCRKNMYGRMVLDCIERETQTVIEFSNSSEIHSLPAGDEGDTLRGFTAHMIIIDEAAMINNEVYIALEPMFATTFNVGQLILISTPRGIQNYFYEAYNSGNLGFVVYKAKSSQSPLITREFLKSQKSQMTNNEFLQEYEGAFLDETDTFFPLHEIEGVMTQDAVWKDEHDSKFEYYLGYDPAGVGEDEAVGVILERRPEHLVNAGAREFAVVSIVIRKKCGLGEQVALIKHLHGKWDFKRICIDITGLGMGFPESLPGMPVEGILFNIKTIEDLYNNGKKFFESRTLIMPLHIKMKKQLNEMKFEYRKGDGRLNVFNPRKHAKTDHPTALMLALWATKKKIHEILIDSGRGLLR
jgi:hypothetical protein